MNTDKARYRMNPVSEALDLYQRLRADGATHEEALYRAGATLSPKDYDEYARCLS